MTQVKFVKYMHLMMDILNCVTETSELFQTSDLLIMEVNEAINTLYTNLHAMTVTPGHHLNEFYSEFDPSSRLYKGIKLRGPLPKPFAEDNDVQAFIRQICTDVLQRFANLSEPPLSYFQAFDTRLWPRQLKTISVHGSDSIQALCNYYAGAGLLSSEEKECILSEYHKVNVRFTMTEEGVHPLGFLTDILKDKSKRFSHISTLIELMMCVSPSTAACERAFSTMKIVKTPTRSKLNQLNLSSQLRIAISGSSLEEFNPGAAVLHWLKSGSGSRHLTYKTRQSQSETATQAASSQNDTEKLCLEVYQTLSDEHKDQLTKCKDQCCVQ